MEYKMAGAFREPRALEVRGAPKWGKVGILPDLTLHFLRGCRLPGAFGGGGERGGSMRGPVLERKFVERGRQKRGGRQKFLGVWGGRGERSSGLFVPWLAQVEWVRVKKAAREEIFDFEDGGLVPSVSKVGMGGKGGCPRQPSRPGIKNEYLEGRWKTGWIWGWGGKVDAGGIEKEGGVGYECGEKSG